MGLPRRMLRYPSLFLQGIDKIVGMGRGRWEFGVRCRVSPLSQIFNPDQVHIGANCYIAPFSVIRPIGTAEITFGDDCTLQQFGFIAGSVTLGDDVRIANKVSIHSFNHSTNSDELIRKQPLDMGRVTIGDDVWIGTNATVLKDVEIGEGSVVAAGAVVTEDVEPYTVVAGAPAEKIGER